MEGNVVTAAKWLGAAMVLASAILVGGLRWVLSSKVEWDRAVGTPPIQAIEAKPPVPSPGELEELAKSFRGLGPEPNALPSERDQPRLLFAEPPTEAAPGPTQDGTGP